MKPLYQTIFLPVLLLTGCAAAVSEVPPATKSAPAAHEEQVQECAAAWAALYADEPADVRILLAHDLLCRTCCYDTQADDRHTAYGALLGGAAVCDGYAAAFAALMQAAGIPVLTVTGTADGTAHAWNLIACGERWYHVDCTWDDSSEPASHTFFLRDDAFMRETHTWNAEDYPAASGGKLRFETVIRKMALHKP